MIHTVAFSLHQMNDDTSKVYKHNNTLYSQCVIQKTNFLFKYEKVAI